MNKFVGLVPARSGSKSIINKNMQIVGDYSLVARAIKAGIEAGIKNTYISTNSLEYGNEAKAYGGKFEFLRPEKISKDKSTDNDYLEHFIKWCQDHSVWFEYLVLLRPTSPFRETKIIKKALSVMQNLGETASSLRSAHIAPESPYKWFKRDNLGFFRSIDGKLSATEVNMPRQNFEDVFIPNGYIDILRWQNIVEGSFWGDNMFVFKTDTCHEIDTKEQLDVCQIIASKENFKNG